MLPVFSPMQYTHTLDTSNVIINVFAIFRTRSVYRMAGLPTNFGGPGMKMSEYYHEGRAIRFRMESLFLKMVLPGWFRAGRN